MEFANMKPLYGVKHLIVTLGLMIQAKLRWNDPVKLEATKQEFEAAGTVRRSNSD